MKEQRMPSNTDMLIGEEEHRGVRVCDLTATAERTLLVLANVIGQAWLREAKWSHWWYSMWKELLME